MILPIVQQAMIVKSPRGSEMTLLGFKMDYFRVMALDASRFFSLTTSA